MTKQDFKHLYNIHFDEVRNYIYYRCGNTELASDVVQEVFMKVWNKKDRLNTNNIKGLLYKMASDTFINNYRKEKVANQYLDHLKLTFKEEEDQKSLEYKELKTVYENCLGSLNENCRTVFLMSRMEEMTYKEIAERLEISVKTVEKRMSQTLKELRLKLNVNGIA